MIYSFSRSRLARGDSQYICEDISLIRVTFAHGLDVPVRMRGNLMPTISQRYCYVGVAFESLAASIRGYRHLVGLEKVEQPPNARPGSILIITLSIERSLLGSTRTVTLFPKKAFRMESPFRTVRSAPCVGVQSWKGAPACPASITSS